MEEKIVINRSITIMPAAKPIRMRRIKARASFCSAAFFFFPLPIKNPPHIL
jgi:hypothetical protein